MLFQFKVLDIIFFDWRHQKKATRMEEGITFVPSWLKERVDIVVFDMDLTILSVHTGG
jgi:hypothetical protein